MLGGSYGAGAPDFGNGPIAASSPPQFGFVVKFGPSGTTLWSEGSVSAANIGHAVALDGAGNVLVADVDASGFYVQKLDPSGQQVWKKSWKLATLPSTCNGQSSDPRLAVHGGRRRRGERGRGREPRVVLLQHPHRRRLRRRGDAFERDDGPREALADGCARLEQGARRRGRPAGGIDAIAVDAAGDIFFRENGASPNLRKLDPDGSLAWSQAMPGGLIMSQAVPVAFAPGGDLVYVSETQGSGNVADVTRLDPLGHTALDEELHRDGLLQPASSRAYSCSTSRSGRRARCSR